jgi:hypothetical protein
MSVSVKVRFDIFKRDDFTCRYCGLCSPEVVLEIDHIVPVCEGGSDDPINLTTSCWSCNRGKGGTPLEKVIAGEDPHERAILLLERERQLKEYNAVLAVVNERIEHDCEILVEYWKDGSRRDIYGTELTSLENALKKHPIEKIICAMELAIRARKTHGLAYVHACLNNWARDEQAAANG